MSSLNKNREILEKIEKLSPTEKEALRDIIKKINKGEVSFEGVLNELRGYIYDYVPVDMKTFLEDPYYLGEISDFIYEPVRETLIQIFEGNYNIVILTGSIGWGKTTTASIATVRLIYELLCYKKPARVFGLFETTPIALLLLGPYKEQVSVTLFANVANLINSIKFFRERIRYKIDETDSVIVFPDKNLLVLAKPGSDSSILAHNVISAVIDEANFYGKETYKRVNTIYNMLIARMKSRYLEGGKLPAKLFLISSAGSWDSFVETKIRELQGRENVFIRRYAIWDVKKDYYASERFPVFIGTRSMPPRILKDSEVEFYSKNFTDDEPKGEKVIWVPVDFEQDFKDDIYMSLRDLAGVSTISANPFFGDIKRIYECVVSEGKPLPTGEILQHPFNVLEWKYQVDDLYIEWDKITRSTQYGRIPIINPRAPRFVHIDLGIREDACGICMGHIAGFERGKLYTKPIVYIDFLLRVIPPKSGEILISDIRNIILEFLNNNFDIKVITMDKFQSIDTIQMFRQFNLEAYNLSVEKYEAYKLLKDVIYERRVYFYDYPPLVSELIKLELNITKGKVDHPEGGSKDVADALCGVINSIYDYISSRKDVSIPTEVIYEELRKVKSEVETVKSFGVNPDDDMLTFINEIAGFYRQKI